MKKKLVFIIAVTVFSIMAVMAVFFLNNKKNYIDDSTYIANVYPLLPKKDLEKMTISQLNFFYSPLPESARGYRYASQLSKPPEINQLYCLSWMISCGNMSNGTVFKNLYSYKKQGEFIYEKGFPSHSKVEVMHYGWYHEPGIFYYQAKGTGVFLDLGKTLVASNKLDALRKLGLSDIEILANSTQYVFPYPKEIYLNTYSTIKQYALDNHIAFSRAISMVYNSVINNTDYKLNRIADSADYDVALYLACVKKHYDTIQLTTSPNDKGGWGFEIMDCRTSLFDTLLNRWNKEKQFIEECNPLDHTQCRPCQFKLPLKDKLYCEK